MTDSEAKEPVSESPASARRSQRAQLGSVIAVVLSVVALGLNLYQTRLLQTQARASVWPYLSIGFRYFDSGEHPGFTWTIDNNGVGPAIVKSVRLTLDDRPVRSWSELLPLVLEHGAVKAVMAGIHSEVIPPGTNRETTIEAIRLVEPEPAKALMQAVPRLKMDICYCSVYDDCWIAHSLSDDVEPVSRCEPAGDAEFQN